MNETFVFNRAVMLDRLDGDEELVQTMCDLFVDEAAGYVENLERAWTGGDAETLRREAHTLKSLLATYVDDVGKAMAHTVEVHAKDGVVAGLAAEVEALKARVLLVAAVLAQLSGDR